MARFEGIDFYKTDELFSSEERMVRDTVRSWVEDRLIPIIGEAYTKRRFPEEIIPELAELGVLGANLPEEYGCAGLNNVSYGLIMQELERGDSGVRSFASVQGALVMYPIYAYGSEEQRMEYLPKLASGEMIGCFGLTEPGTGCDPASMQTRAIQVGAAWIIYGGKMWVSNGGIADLALVFAQTDPSLPRHEAYKGIGAFLVERSNSGFSSIDLHGKMGLRSSNTAQLVFQDCHVGQENLLGEVGRGFQIAMSALDNGRYSTGACAVGIGQACIDASTSYSQERYQFGRVIGEFQLVQDLLVEMVVENEASRLLVPFRFACS